MSVIRRCICGLQMVLMLAIFVYTPLAFVVGCVLIGKGMSEGWIVMLTCVGCMIVGMITDYLGFTGSGLRLSHNTHFAKIEFDLLRAKQDVDVMEAGIKFDELRARQDELAKRLDAMETGLRLTMLDHRSDLEARMQKIIESIRDTNERVIELIGMNFRREMDQSMITHVLRAIEQRGR